MAGSAARPERGNTKMAKNGPETTEQQRVGLGGRRGATPMPRMSGGCAEPGRFVFHSVPFFFFFPRNYSTLGLFLFIFALFTAFPSHLEPWRMLRVPPRCSELWEPKRLQLRKRDSGEKKRSHKPTEKTRDPARGKHSGLLISCWVVFPCGVLFFYCIG